MPRNIVVCLDGTKNTPVTNDTNVVRIFRLAREYGHPNIAHYCPGIGTFPRPGTFRFLFAKLFRIFGLASGHGAIDNLNSAYSFLNETYQDGDRLFFFGFQSRCLHGSSTCKHYPPNRRFTTGP